MLVLSDQVAQQGLFPVRINSFLQGDETLSVLAAAARWSGTFRTRDFSMQVAADGNLTLQGTCKCSDVSFTSLSADVGDHPKDFSLLVYAEGLKSVIPLSPKCRAVGLTFLKRAPGDPYGCHVLVFHHAADAA